MRIEHGIRWVLSGVLRVRSQKVIEVNRQRRALLFDLAVWVSGADLLLVLEIGVFQHLVQEEREHVCAGILRRHQGDPVLDVSQSQLEEIHESLAHVADGMVTRHDCLRRRSYCGGRFCKVVFVVLLSELL